MQNENDHPRFGPKSAAAGYKRGTLPSAAGLAEATLQATTLLMGKLIFNASSTAALEAFNEVAQPHWGLHPWLRLG